VMAGSVLTSGQAALILFGVFFGLMFLRVPVAFALALACLPILVIEPRLSAVTLMQETFNAYNSFILLAVPFFLLTANLMNTGGITDRLMSLSRSMVGHFPGGLAQINVVLSFFFAGISGSSTADAASQSKVFIEAQRKEGYDDSFSVAITAVSAVLAVIIPPSILMIVWGGILTVSIGALFLAGIIPGLLIALAQMATVHAYAVARGYPTYPRATWAAFFSATVVSIPALLTPGIIIGGKIFGWFTATESACIAVLYAGFLSLLVYREMDLRGLYSALVDTGKFAGIALFCVGTASAFGWLLAYYQIPKAILSGVSAWEMGPIATGFFIAGVFLVVGCFLDAIPAIIIVGTILDPLARSAGLDPVHFAMIGIVSLAFGLVTPPYGLCLMIACSIAGIRMKEALRDTLIMLLPMLAVLALLILWPQVALFIPSLVSPEFLR
jgi:tripartite ATP-independent transporter DctM subunit